MGCCTRRNRAATAETGAYSEVPNYFPSVATLQETSIPGPRTVDTRWSSGVIERHSQKRGQKAYSVDSIPVSEALKLVRRCGFFRVKRHSHCWDRGGVEPVVRPERFELPTFWFVARRSIQLSYGRNCEWMEPRLGPTVGIDYQAAREICLQRTRKAVGNSLDG